jgi:hypothetical protein
MEILNLRGECGCVQMSMDSVAGLRVGELEGELIVSELTDSGASETNAGWSESAQDSAELGGGLEAFAG